MFSFKITRKWVMPKVYLRSPQLSFITPSKFKSSNCNETVDDWIKSLPENEQKRVKLINNEIALKQANGERMPHVELLTKANYEEMLKMPNNQRPDYYIYLGQTQANIKTQKTRQLIRNERYKEIKQLNDLKPKSGHIEYGLNKNCQFPRIGSDTISKWKNVKLLRFIRLNGPRLIFDCDFDDEMSNQRINDVARQIKFAFSDNRNHLRPFIFHLCNIHQNSMLWQNLNRHMQNAKKLPWYISSKDITEEFPLEKLVYLSPDATDVLEKFNPDDHYVIGSVCDKGNEKPFTLAKAKRLGIRTARLPIDKYIRRSTQQALTLDQMTNIMLELKQTQDWNKAFKFIPERKIGGYRSHELISSTKSKQNSIDQPTKLRLRTKNLPPFPYIECIRDLKVENYLPSSCKVTRHGEYEFLEKSDGHVCVYITGYHNKRDVDAKSGYSVFFGQDHPLNLQGSVERRQGINHARFYAFLKGLQQIPENLFTKLCIMVDDPRFITFIDKGLRRMSENSFRSVTSGKLNEDLQTSMEVNQILRLRQDLKFQLIYCPSDVSSEGMSYAKKLARDAADKATLDAKHSRTS